MIPGKTYKAEDYVEIAWRRRWMIVAPVVVITAATAAIAYMLPDRYRSQATLLIVPQRVPPDLVRPTITTRLDERLQAHNQQILSRTRLERIVQEFDLYPEQRRTMIMDDVIEMMRTKGISISFPIARNAEAGSFTVSFQYRDARTAMLVTERIASLFIRENLEDRTVLTDQTAQFLQSQLEDTKRRLKEHEVKLEEFRRAHPMQLPAQFEANQQGLQNAHLQLQAVQESINRDRDQIATLRRQMDELAVIEDPPGTGAAPAPSSADGPGSAARELEIARAELQAAEQKLKPEHPDIRAYKRRIAELQKKAEEEALTQPVSQATRLSPAERARATRLSGLQAAVESMERRLAQRQEDEKGLFASISNYRQRLEVSPAVESKLTELMRDYTTLQTQYQDLLTKSQEAKVAANLERRQIGEQFKIVDSARTPQRPTSPNRLQLNLMGALLGLVAGIGLAVVLEYRDKSLRTEEDVFATLSLPVLALVPTMATAVDRRNRKRRRLLLASSGVMMVSVCIALITWKFETLLAWVR